MTAYTVVGGGAIGGTLAFHLARAGHDIRIVDADEAHVAAIRRCGLVVGSNRYRRLTAVTPAELGRDTAFDRVLLAVKAQATGAALDVIEPRLAGTGWVASLQNGLLEPVIARRVGAGRTISAFVNFAADVVEPGVIREGGEGALVVGEPDGTRSARVNDLAADLTAWGPARSSDNVQGYLWAKLGYGSMLIATALADEPMAGLIDRYRPLMHRLVREVFAVAATHRVALEAFDAFEPHAYTGDSGDGRADRATDRLVTWLRTLPKQRSGIWRDIAVRHRPTEVSAQFGPVLGRADGCGVPVPGLRALLAAVGEVESGRAQMGEALLRGLAGQAAG